MQSTETWQTVWTNVNLMTMETVNSNQPSTILHGAIAVSDGKICWLGKQKDLPRLSSNTQVIDGENCWLTPGLIDCHTHLVYGGNRALEFEQRLNGESYEAIAKAGGGIVSTVNATRKASEQELLKLALPRLTALYNEGVTTVEIKSGYGLTTESEQKMLSVATKLQQQLPITIKRTFLGAHALPVEYKNRPDEYINLVCDEMIPKLAANGLIDAVDIFCESIGFNLQQTQQVFDCAKHHNLPIKVHAEQLSNLGASKLAANYQALSSDHLEYLTESDVIAMAQANMVAVILPGAFYFLREKQLPPINLLRKHGVPMAIATDANPGSSPIHSLQLMLNMACTLFSLTPSEALMAVTRNAAQALGIQHEVGRLSVGLNADFALWNVQQPAELCYQYGVNPLKALIKQGKRVI